MNILIGLIAFVCCRSLVSSFSHHGAISGHTRIRSNIDTALSQRSSQLDNVNSIPNSPAAHSVIGIKKALGLAGIISVLPMMVATSLPTSAAAAGVTEDTFIDTLATLIEAKKIIEPTERYVFVQSYDSARSNIQYVLNQLQLQKKIDFLVRNSVDFNEDLDAVEAAGEAGGRITNNAMQLDSTIYTCVFIPNDDPTDITPTAQKYRKEATNYYNALNKDFDVLLKLGSEEQLKAAEKIADERLKSVPPVLFKKL
eukprot:CAMPEP_0174999414 /NCGR_PEP_ID=MMETSP0005-20121125/2035_1 /TAXON_ID=420556 /ORGANISM="Ochromonas sp., Strain CCMP1393" /LENGTH=254 /DNA_ID=CAMNT_0016254127 /DNA_START=42 /DNA_END=806 /DNA_ORIENTATION=+